MSDAYGCLDSHGLLALPVVTGRHAWVDGRGMLRAGGWSGFEMELLLSRSRSRRWPCTTAAGQIRISTRMGCQLRRLLQKRHRLNGCASESAHPQRLHAYGKCLHWQRVCSTGQRYSLLYFHNLLLFRLADLRGRVVWPHVVRYARMLSDIIFTTAERDL